MLIPSSEITPEDLCAQRRRAIARLGGLLAGPLFAPASAGAEEVETPNSWAQITRYNNYYEFSTNKEVVWKLAEAFEPQPWTLAIDGEIEKPVSLSLEEVLRRYPQQERIYRLRCVEGWSMVIPWTGFPLATLLKDCRLTSRAKFVEFTSVQRPQQMPGQRLGTLIWPYTEGLRIDEAMHPLTLIVSGLYGKPLPNQNGAPLRLVVPWKYGFKSAKALVRIRLTESMPQSSWMRANSTEYGFYANVNPDVAHPRWSQRKEVRIGDIKKHATLLFNGYAEQVAHLYAGMDLAKYF